jgi:glycerophosphoryl diester phosphodiesterase
MLQLPKVIGHRGAMAYAPENTLASFHEARRRGATWVEIDVKLTADGVPIVMHDASLKRTTGIDRLVAETPRAELPRDVPTFEEAIACFQELGLGCNVEIKPCEGREAETARVTVATLRRCWPSTLPPPLLSSFKPGSLAAAREAAPEFARSCFVNSTTIGASGPTPSKRPASTPTARSSPRAVPARSSKRVLLSASTPSTTARLPGRWLPWAWIASSPTCLT